MTRAADTDMDTRIRRAAGTTPGPAGEDMSARIRRAAGLAPQPQADHHDDTGDSAATTAALTEVDKWINRNEQTPDFDGGARLSPRKPQDMNDTIRRAAGF